MPGNTAIDTPRIWLFIAIGCCMMVCCFPCCSIKVLAPQPCVWRASDARACPGGAFLRSGAAVAGCALACERAGWGWGWQKAEGKGCPYRPALYHKSGSAVVPVAAVTAVVVVVLTPCLRWCLQEHRTFYESFPAMKAPMVRCRVSDPLSACTAVPVQCTWRLV